MFHFCVMCGVLVDELWELARKRASLVANDMRRGPYRGYLMVLDAWQATLCHVSMCYAEFNAGVV